MRMKAFCLILLLLATVLLGSCGSTVQPPSSDTTQVADTTEPSPDEIPDPFERVRKSEEKWLFYGLVAYEIGREPEDLREFFSVPANMTYLTLYEHMFAFDPDKAIPVAEALFAFIYNEYGADALTDMDKRCEYKTAYLRSLGVDREYPQTKEVERFLSSMDCTSDATYKYVISYGNVTYYFKNLDLGSLSQYHGLLYYSTTGLFDMIAYMEAKHLSDGLDTERQFEYYMTFDGSESSKTVTANGKMYINSFTSMLHEAVHAMGVTNNGNVWLSEGICSYFGRCLGFNDQITAAYIQLLTMAKKGDFDERAKAGDSYAVFCKRLYEEYAERGGRMESVDVFDLRLLTDVSAKIELELGDYKTLGETNKSYVDAIGKELSYEQSLSLVCYLADIYGMETVLKAYHTQDIELAFGKGYEDLKADWLLYLNT